MDNLTIRECIYEDLDNIIEFYKKHDYKTWCIQMFK
jgi:hypothetical protein